MCTGVRRLNRSALSHRALRRPVGFHTSPKTTGCFADDFHLGLAPIGDPSAALCHPTGRRTGSSRRHLVGRRRRAFALGAPIHPHPSTLALVSCYSHPAVWVGRRRGIYRSPSVPSDYIVAFYCTKRKRAPLFSSMRGCDDKVHPPSGHLGKDENSVFDRRFTPPKRIFWTEDKVMRCDHVVILGRHIMMGSRNDFYMIML